MFHEVTSSIIHHDPYMVLADFEDYRNTQQRIAKDFLDRDNWNKMSLMNISGAGRFAADRAINEYAANIWNAKSALKK
jgi:starch phosphorylase